MSMTPEVLVLAFLLTLFVYPFAAFPLLMKLLARRRKQAPGFAEPAEWPTVTLVVCALNEERVIGAKAENALALDYPRNRLRILFVSDGSTDKTAEIIRTYAPKGVELIERENRRGKVANLNEVVPQLESEIVVLSDANVIYDEKALKRLVSRFNDPRIGGVTGKVILCDTTEEFRNAEGGYYSLEWQIQETSSEIYSMAGTDGAMFAMRREAFTVCPNDTLIEDYVVALSIVKKGYRMVMEPEALAWEEGPKSLGEEYRRKVRIAAGAAQSLIQGNGWPVGAPARFWFLFVSHKLLRWLGPLTGVAALAAAVAAWPHWLATGTLAGFGLIVFLAVVRWSTGWTASAVNAPFYFLFGQSAVLVGLLRGIRGTQTVLWAKANR